MTVAMERHDYLTKMTNLLNDEDTYMVVKKDPTKRLISQLHDILTLWKNKEYMYTGEFISLFELYGWYTAARL